MIDEPADVAGSSSDPFDGEAAPESLSADVIDPPASDELTTEWFSVEDEFEAEVEVLPRREHHVTAVIVSHDGETWLPAVLTTLSQQARPADVAVGVDTGSQDSSAALLESSLGPDRTIVLAESTGFGVAAQAGLAHLTRPEHRPFTPDAIEWVWLLHDDSAPDANCLEALLNTADDNPSASILGPKILGWHDRRLLLEAGVTVDGGGRRITGLERAEHDQGQHDGVRDVLSVSSAGMLVRRDVWDSLEGFDPSLALFRDDLDFCWRAHRRGERVLIATDAVLHHREASAHGRRAHDLAPRPHRADREAAVHVLLAQAAAWSAILLAIRLLLGSLGRAGIFLLGKDVAAARDEVAAVLALALHPSRISHSRALVRRTTTEPASAINPLRQSAATTIRRVAETATGVLTTSGSSTPSSSVSALDSGPVGDDADYLDDGSAGLFRRLVVRHSVLLILVLAVVSAFATRGLWFGDGVLQGGALLPSPSGVGDVMETYRQAWHDVGPGSTTPAPPYLLAIASLGFFMLGSANAAVNLLMLLGIPLAGFSAYVTLRGLVPSKAIRVWAGAAYALLPAMTGAVASGRIATIIAAIALPFALRSLVRIISEGGTLRRSAGTALIVALVLAAAPGLWLVLLVAGVVGGIYLQRTRGTAARPIQLRLVVALIAPLILLLPWTLYLFANPVLFLLEPGVPSSALSDASLRPWDVLLLHPGGPGMGPVWFTIGIVIGGLLAFLRIDRIRTLAMIGGVGFLALLFGLIQTLFMVTPPGTAAEIRPWPGPATLMLGLACITAGAVAIHGLRQRFVGASFSLGQPLAAVIAVLAILAPIVTAVWFAIGVPLLLQRKPASAVPAFVAADAAGPQAPRTLVLDRDEGGRVRYTLINGSGPELGDAETSPPASEWAPLDGYVAAMASGRGGEEIDAIAGYGIRYVLLAAGSKGDLIPTLDSEPGLRRLSSSGGEVLWRVAGVTSRARLASPDKAVAIGVADLVSARPYLDQTIPDGSGGRSLVIGAELDSRWSAAVVAADGTRSEIAGEPGAGLLSWSQSFTVPDGSPQVVVEFDSSARNRWMLFQLLVFIALVVIALPERRWQDPDPDQDVAP